MRSTSGLVNAGNFGDGGDIKDEIRNCDIGIRELRRAREYAICLTEERTGSVPAPEVVDRLVSES